MRRDLRGVLVGCDYRHEWMLHWWWASFALCNTLPVAFMDFGMSLEAKEWCKAHGKLISFKSPLDLKVPKASISTSNTIPVEHQEEFQPFYKPYYKPWALLQTPFQETIWMDLDCETLGSVQPLYSKLHKGSYVALARDNYFAAEETMYNTGVIVYDYRALLIAEWAYACTRKKEHEVNDKIVLTELIQQHHIEVSEFSNCYNWIMNHPGINAAAVVLHWAGEWGKQVIRNQLNCV